MVVVEACAAAFERVGLPEGLYPLAQASLYLASAEKSNSLLGVFDALRQVRHSNGQQVPPHLRDANRDGKAFGDGVGYRYPHAYAEHWVAQQYLPKALQGEVFWQPGNLGWEGAQRQRLQLRRAAQLAAAAETELEQGELISAGPADGPLEQWLRRQAAAEGERLDGLRRRFWQGAQWQRHERILVLGARSLLWALDPLAATPEGQVLVAVESAADRQRLEAQLQLLDTLRRPSILLCQPDEPALLAAALEGPVEWVAGRQPFRGLAPAAIEAWITCLDERLASHGHWRLLFSLPRLGPAGGLLALGQQQDEAFSALLQELTNLEQQALALEFAPAIHCQSCLEARHWLLDRERWQETLTLEITPTRIERWLAQGSSWRRQLETVANRRLSQGELQQLQRGFEAGLGQPMPQQLEHLLVTSRRGPDSP